MKLFYSPDIVSDTCILKEEEALHCLRVLRLQKEDEVYITNGKGNLYKGYIENENIKQCSVKITETYNNYQKRNYKLHIGIAPTKNIERFEWFVEKATEIGIDEITPVICEHSERKKINNDRLNRIAVTAMKQSLKAFLPVINTMNFFDEFINIKNNYSKFIGSCDNSVTSFKLYDKYISGNDVIIFIGPEGDFSLTEINKAQDKEFIPINLGENRYRTETAAILACHVVNLKNSV